PTNGSLSPGPDRADVTPDPRPAHGAPPAGPALACLLASVLATTAPSALAGTSSVGPRMGVPGMRESDNGSLLVVYYQEVLRDHDIESFQQQASARYTEGTLPRLIETGDAPARRAGVLALGLLGSMASNAAVARALRDSDSTVRDLAD